MCGCFTNELTWPELYALYNIHNEGPKSNAQPRHNVAPTQEVDFVQIDKAGNMEFDRGRWWLVSKPRSLAISASCDDVMV